MCIAQMVFSRYMKLRVINACRMAKFLVVLTTIIVKRFWAVANIKIKLEFTPYPIRSLQNHHTVTKGVKAVLFFHGLQICLINKIFAGKRTCHTQGGRVREVEIGN